MSYKPWRQFSGMSKHVLSNGDALWISGFTWMRSLTLISSSSNDLVLIYKNTWNDTLFSGNYISITWFLKCNLIGLGFSGGSAGKESACNAGDAGDTGLIPGLGKSLEKEMATHSSISLGKSHGQRSLVGYSPWGHKESDTTERLNTHKNSYSTFLLNLH